MMSPQQKISINGVPETMLQTMYARAKETAILSLKTAYTYAVAFDEFMSRNETYRYTRPFFDKVEYKIKDIYRTGTTTKVEDFYEALGRSAFDPIRDREDFKALYKE